MSFRQMPFRRTINELEVLYKLEKKVFDVFVEGGYDRGIVTLALKNENPPSNVSVKRIDIIEIPDDLLFRYSLTRGEKQEVIALCRKLCESLGDKAVGSFAGVVDQDHDWLLGVDQTAVTLKRTDYSSMELYFISEANLEKVLTIAFPEKDLDAAAVLNAVTPIAREVFYFRAALASLRISAKIIDFANFIDVRKGSVRFEIDGYKRHVLETAQKRFDMETVNKEITRLKERRKDDFRFESNGHDLIYLISLFLRSVFKKQEDIKKSNADNLSSLLSCSSELLSLRAEPLFVDLLERAAKAKRGYDPAR